MAGNNGATPRVRRIALVLGGGGLKGFAHIGVLRALAEHGVLPSVFAGTSIGALIAAAHVGGMHVDEMERRATSMRKTDLFRINHLGVLLERMRASSLYMEEPLRQLVSDAVLPGDFSALDGRLLVNTVDIERGVPIVWGLPGLRDVAVADAVYASCALPGYFPPGIVDDRTCVDGGVIDNLPAAIAAIGADAVIAVDVGSSDLSHRSDIASHGFAAVYMRAATVMMSALQQTPLSSWRGPPMVLIRPRVSHVGWLTFTHTAELIAEGYRAASAALATLDECLAAPGGIHPRRTYHLSVNRNTCTGCGLCAAQAPTIMGLDDTGKAFPLATEVEWSPADGQFVSQCPVDAIAAEPVAASRVAVIPASPASPASPGAVAPAKAPQ
ncbi:MAG: patatin-like phospholipase family protein [Gemmatimonadaceae bacterium]